MTNVNNMELGKFNEKAYREDRIEKMNTKLGINGYRDIEGLWDSTASSGGKFETIFGQFMTREQVVNFFNSNLTSVRWYSDERSEYKEELEEMGVKLFLNSELKEMKNSFISGDTAYKNCQDDITISWKIPGKGTVLYPLAAVVRLGMFMTGTPAAKLFRNAIQTCLQEKQILTKVTDTVQANMLKCAYKSLKEDKKLPSEEVMESALLLLETTNNSLTRIKKNLHNLELLYNALDEFGDINKMKANLAQPWMSELHRISSELNKEAYKYYEQLVDDINTDTREGRDKVFQELFPKRYETCLNKTERNRVTNDITKEYIKMGIFKAKPFESRNKETNETKTKYSILAGNKFTFLEMSKYGNFKHGDNEVLKFTELGKKFLSYAYEFYYNDKTKFNRIIKDDKSFLDFVYLELHHDEFEDEE